MATGLVAPLKTAYRIIQTSWRKDFCADTTGLLCHWFNERAFSFDVLGAMEVAFQDRAGIAEGFLLLDGCAPGASAINFADHPDATHKQVLEMFECAIARARRIEAAR